jgi:hypothetical protein
MWRNKMKATSGLTALLLIGMVGCTELEVQNPNAPDAARALSSSDDVEALIAGAYDSWQRMLRYGAFQLAASAMTFEHTAPWANAGMEFYARIPRVPVQNVSGGRDVGNLSYGWTRAYRAISAVRSGLVAIDDGTVDLGDDDNRTLRARAYGKFMQGLAHASLALMHDSAFVYDETMDAALEDLALMGYGDVMTAALGYFAEAATLAGSGAFTIPDTWMSVDVPSTTLEQMAHSMAASFRANVGRTPAERAAVDWNAVATDVGLGVTADWANDGTCWPHVFCDHAMAYRVFPGWNMAPNWVLGMADQSGGYQAWINTPTIDKLAFLYQTPDLRFPQGATEIEQIANPGVRFTVTEGSDGSRVWNRPDRGTWRWSYYYNTPPEFYRFAMDESGPTTLVSVREGRLLLAERAYRGGDMATVASIVNETRVAAGLNATDAAGLNTSCVPKLPNGSCGDLWEMFKWEKRLETHFMGTPLRNGWWFDGRGWGDLMEGTLMHLPVPYREMQLLLEQPYNLGGVGGNSAAPVGTYGY